MTADPHATIGAPLQACSATLPGAWTPCPPRRRCRSAARAVRELGASSSLVSMASASLVVRSSGRGFFLGDSAVGARAKEGGETGGGEPAVGAGERAAGGSDERASGLRGRFSRFRSALAGALRSSFARSLLVRLLLERSVLDFSVLVLASLVAQKGLQARSPQLAASSSSSRLPAPFCQRQSAHILSPTSRWTGDGDGASELAAAAAATLSTTTSTPTSPRASSPSAASTAATSESRISAGLPQAANRFSATAFCVHIALFSSPTPSCRQTQAHVR